MAPPRYPAFKGAIAAVVGNPTSVNTSMISRRASDELRALGEELGGQLITTSEVTRP